MHCIPLTWELVRRGTLDGRQVEDERTDGWVPFARAGRGREMIDIRCRKAEGKGKEGEGGPKEAVNVEADGATGRPANLKPA